ncbi:protein kinase domain-containing protein [Streptomyces indicus]|uniref:Serine/threonine protein kinase n=1 Tax=Streptomyces indicus TaxID=417292 RepID=A0A1G8VU79_9ACTN|nr:protein kinase [Streptomyces indicus]SDJ69397.1 Serine/threonine protein kinase [Streptomyces indicus]
MPTPLTHDDPASLGPYRLVARLGSGGMGTVYVARTPGGATVALKTMHPGIAETPEARTRFRLEIDAARVIGGQFGARVIDADPLAATPWLATEYVLGPALDEAVEAAGPLPEKTVRAVGAALCAALEQLHRSEVVHRDLKPSNILITAYGPKVIDFGIARALGDARLTRTGSAVGTPAFMSPEQATGQDHGAAGDVFALAGVLVYSARGSSPFGSGQAADLLYRVRYGEADLDGVPASLAPVLARCLAKDPAQRPRVLELAAQLHDGGGEFAEQLPDSLMGLIGQRAADVWHVPPQRLPAPVDAFTPGGVSAPVAAGADTSRRRFLFGGGVLAATALMGGGAWWWSTSGEKDKSGSGAAASGPEQTRNLDPLWSTKSSYRILEWGLPTPLPVEGVIHLPFRAVTMRFDPETGSRTEDLVADGSPWQVDVVEGREYRLGPNHDKAVGGVTPAGIDVWNKAQDYLQPTPAVFSGTVAGLDGNQLLCVRGSVAYVVVGTGKEWSNGFLASQKFTLRAADIRTGRTLWSKPLPKRPDNNWRLHFLTAEVVGERLVTLQETEPGTVRVVVRDVGSGNVLWEKPYGKAEDPDALQSPLAVAGGLLFLGGERLRAWRIENGDEVWKSASGVAYSPPAYASGVVYAVGQGVGLSALAADSGEVAWTETSDTVSEASLAWRPLVTRRYGYYRNGVQLHAIDLRNHKAGLTYKTAATRFYADAPDRLVLGMGESTLSAYPLK